MNTDRFKKTGIRRGRPLTFCGGAVLLCAGLLNTQSVGVIYEVPSTANHSVGVWDANIMADDVHFETAAVISEIRIPLAIHGKQKCALWVFDALNSPPIHVEVFTNVPAAHEYDFTWYSFDMELQVPPHIYIGFSAQGDGWGGNLSDYWSRGFSVAKGIPGSMGRFYFGAVSGQQLTSEFQADALSFGSLLVRAAPVQVSEFYRETGYVHMVIGRLPIHATNILEKSGTLMESDWMEVETLPMGAAHHMWHEEMDGHAPLTIYRIRSR